MEEPRKILCDTPKKERQLRNTLLGDNSSSIKITVWEELFDQIPDHVTLKFTSVKLDSYYGL